MPSKKKERKFRFPPKKMHLTPQEKVRANYMYLQGYDTEAIAAEFGLTQQQVCYLVREQFRPAWQESMKADAERELAKIDNLERQAWEAFNNEETPNPVWMHQIRWCISMRAKLHRNYDQQFREADAELRVGGAVNRETVEREMAIRLLKIATDDMRRQEEQDAAARAARRKPTKKRPADDRGSEKTEPPQVEGPGPDGPASD